VRRWLVLFAAVQDPLDRFLWLAHQVGREDRGLALLHEGSVAARGQPGQILTKRQGASLERLTGADAVACAADKTAALLDLQTLDSAETTRQLRGVTLAPDSPMPGYELSYLGWLLTLEGANFVAQGHPVGCLQVLCSPAGEKFADHRLFPDEVTFCGPQAVYVPYVEPGLGLGREIRSRVLLYMRRNYNRVPRLILLQNHGAIGVGPTPERVLAALMMAEKAAQVLVGAARLGGAVFLPPPQVARIDALSEDSGRARNARV
jgi:rhamnose utilization protein RhaD (predicted bifunctional aldolase and dehydrogenase)